MKKLVFFTSVTGHNIEFIHHLYMGFYNSDREAIFVLPEKFVEQKRLMLWPDCDRITFDLMPMAEVGSICDPIYKKSFRFSKLLHKYMHKNKVRDVFVADIMGLMPFLPIFLSSKDLIFGLTFGVYLYRWNTRPRWKSLIEAFMHWLMSRTNGIHRVYVGNDSSASAYYNKLFKTCKYLYCPDPFNMATYKRKNMRAEYNIPESRKIMYHFGAMGGRKGTEKILQSIVDMTPEERECYCFVFAGIVQDKETFYDYVKKINDTNLVLVFDRFCEFDFLQQWCASCDVVLIPYSHTHSSSGIIGYAAYHHKPVIGPSSGLIGKLIRRNHLGLDLPEFSSSTMRKSYKQVLDWQYVKNDYIEKNSVEKFNHIVVYDK